MNQEQLTLFQAAVIAAVEKHIANGGYLRVYGFGHGQHRCPIACVASYNPDVGNTAEALSQVLGFEVSSGDMWSFIDGFDGNSSSIYDGSELCRFGRSIRQAYAEYIVP